LNHPIIGDRPWGCNKQNKLFLELWSVDTMMLLACSLEFKHPFTQEELCIQTDFSEQMHRLINLFDKNT
jgi:tRNA pseudouridine65 synthase